MQPIARPLKRGIKKTLRAIGYDLVATHRAPATEPWPADPREVDQLESELSAFAEHQPDRGPWSDPSRAREYLSNRRLAFYHDVLRTCREHRVRFENRRIADVGSGTGYLMRLIHQQAPTATLTGYDVYGDIIALARHLCTHANFVHRDLFQLNGDRHDLVFATEVIEHLLDPDGAVHALLNATSPGGHLFLTVPNGRTDSLPAEGIRPDGRGYWGHIHFWSPESWPLFIAGNAGTRRFDCGTLATGENFALIHVD